MRFGVPYAGVRDEDCRSAINSYFCLVSGKFGGLWAVQVMTRLHSGPHFLDALCVLQILLPFMRRNAAVDRDSAS
jgi:hypothetical protein